MFSLFKVYKNMYKNIYKNDDKIWKKYKNEFLQLIIIQEYHRSLLKKI